MKRFLSSVVLFALLGATCSSFADGMIIVREQEHWHPPIIIPPPWPPRPWPPPHPFAPLEVTYHHVNVKIDGQIATTSVDQEFYNPNPQRLEGTYIFPIPKGAQISKFAMDIGGKQVEAELLAAEKARQIYEDIVRKMRDPALLEYAGQDVFKVRIFPIEPNSHKRIKLSYTQVLKADAGMVGYVYPLNTEKFSAKPIKSVSVKVELETKRPLKTVYSPSHNVEVKRDGPYRATAGYEASDVQPDTDFALYFATEKDELGVSLMSYRKAGEDGYFLLLASPGVDVKQMQILPKDVAFVLDTSGSMAGKKLEQAKKALQFCVENLNDGDRFELVRFATEVEPLFGKLVDASKDNRAKAGDFVKDLKAIGGTAIDDALGRALALRPEQGDRPFVVIFLTDGRPTIGNTDENEIVAHVKKAANSTRVFVFGIGTDVNTHLLDKIADESRAFSQYVLPEEDIEVKVSNFFAKIRDPVLANPKLAFTGDIRAMKLYPSPLPDLFRGDQLVLVGRYSGKGDSAVVLEGSVQGKTRKFTYEVKFPAEASDNEFIPRLWATRRVGFLLDEIRLHGENAELKDEVTDLARKYGIVTPYTAYLIVEDEAKRGVPLAMQTMSGLQNDRAAREVAGYSFQTLRAEKVGDIAVANARGGLAMRQADNAAVGVKAAQTEALSSRNLSALAAGAPSAVPSARPDAGTFDRVARYTQQSQFVNGRNFFQNDKQWVDSEVQKQQNAKKVRIQFASPGYFAFAATNAAARPWLALGQNVQFVLDSMIYEIYE